MPNTNIYNIKERLEKIDEKRKEMQEVFSAIDSIRYDLDYDCPTKEDGTRDYANKIYEDSLKNSAILGAIESLLKIYQIWIL